MASPFPRSRRRYWFRFAGVVAAVLVVVCRSPAPSHATDNPEPQVSAATAPSNINPQCKLNAGMEATGISAGDCAAIASAILALLAMGFSYKSIKQAKLALQGPTIQWCKGQYDDLETAKNAPPADVSGKVYFEKLWDLHFSEFYLYKLESIPIEIYALWLLGRWTEYDKNLPVKGVDHVQGWEDARKRICDKSFEDFIWGLLRLPPKPRPTRDIVQAYIKDNFPKG